MTRPPDRRPARSPSGVITLLAAVTGAGALVASIVRPWGDTGGTSAGFSSGVPVVVPVLVGAAVVALGLGAVVRRAVAASAALALVLAVAGGAVAAVTVAAQVLPRDGGLWALAAAAATAVGALVRAAGTRTRDDRLAAVVGLVLLAVVAAGLVTVRPGWPHLHLTARYDDSVVEAPAPSAVARVGWTGDQGADHSVVGVFDGRIVTRSTGRDCSLALTGSDPRSGDVVWSVDRPLRCGGPGVTAVDGNDQILRVRLGTRDDVYLDPGSGRELFPGPGATRVTEWTQGFGLVLPGPGSAAVGVEAIVPTTGATAWRRPIGGCAGGTVTVGRQPVAATVSPFDGQDPAGALPVVQSGNRILLGYLCRGADGAATRHVLAVDATGTGATDHDVTLTAADTTTPTTFVAGFDTVVAVAPGRLAGIDPTSGATLWTTTPTGPVDDIGFAAASARLVTAVGGTVVVSDRRTGAVVGSWSDAQGDGPAVQLVDGRLQLGADGTSVVLRDVVTGAVRSELAVPDCAPLDVTDHAPRLQLTLGAVLLRCGTGAGVTLTGLVP